MRAVLMIVTEARKFNARVVIAKGPCGVEATDLLQLMSLGAAQGEQLSLEGFGAEAHAALDALEQLFQRKFDED